MDISFADNKVTQIPIYEECFPDQAFFPESYNYFSTDEMYQQDQTYKYTKNTSNY